MDRDSMGGRQAQLPVSPERFKPLARTKRDEPTFTKADAYALVGRLAAQWGYIGQEGREDILAQEFIAQFDGYAPETVTRAATIAIGKCSEFAPTAGAIKEEIRAITKPVAPYDRRGYRPPHGFGPSPEYLEWSRRDRALTIEAAARAKNLPDDDIGFGKIARRALPRV